MVQDFSAGAQALGYFYQARFALLLLLNATEEQQLVLETLDDIVFEEQGTAKELLQLKHTSLPASLTDASPQLWKTLRVWSVHTTTGAITPATTTLTLITTAVARTDSIAARLRPDINRDPETALASLTEVATHSSNASLKPAFDAFLSLSPEQRTTLVDSIQILDSSSDIQSVADVIRDRIKVAVGREHREALYERLEGWWFDKVVIQLRSESPSPVSGFEVHDKIRSVADQFKPDALPIDFEDALPDTTDPTNDSRTFARQLRAIALQRARIEKAIVDYYRAFEQRSRWVREDLLIGDELERYERRLVDEWERFRLALEDDSGNTTLSEPQLQNIGKQIYNWVELTAEHKIRPGVTEPYVMRGSYHMLADTNPPRVWWHPKFRERLAELLGQIGAQQ